MITPNASQYSRLAQNLLDVLKKLTTENQAIFDRDISKKRDLRNRFKAFVTINDQFSCSYSSYEIFSTFK